MKPYRLDPPLGHKPLHVTRCVPFTWNCFGECQCTFWTQEVSRMRDCHSHELKAKLTISKYCN